MDDVVRVIEILDFYRQKNDVPKSKIEEWKSTTHPSILGALVRSLYNNRNCVRPALQMSEFGEIVLSVASLAFEDKVGHDSKSNYSFDSPEAARLLCNWILECHRQLSAQDDAKISLENAKKVIAHYYRSGDEKLRRYLINGTLKYAFETEGIRDFFQDWQNDPLFGPAFQEAAEWAEWIIRRYRMHRAIAEGVAETLSSRGYQEVTIAGHQTGDDAATVEWSTENQSDKSRLVIQSEANFEDAYYSRTNERDFVNSIIAFASNRDNWTQSEWNEKEYSVSPSNLLQMAR